MSKDTNIAIRVVGIEKVGRHINLCDAAVLISPPMVTHRNINRAPALSAPTRIGHDEHT
jgi:hypothetical protein